MAEKQKTLKSPVTVEGKGLHTGLNVKLTFNHNILLLFFLDTQYI